MNDMAGEVQPATAEKDPIRNTSIDAGDKNPKDHVIFDGTSTDLVAVSAVEDGTSTTPDVSGRYTLAQRSTILCTTGYSIKARRVLFVWLGTVQVLFYLPLTRTHIHI